MARGDITIRYETRPCMIERLQYNMDFTAREITRRRAIWHAWVRITEMRVVDIPENAKEGTFRHESLPHEVVYGLVEMENGTVRYERADNIKFVDDLFREFAWPEEDSDETDRC